MIKFAEYPYVRPDMADLTARMEEQIRRILDAKTLGEAFLAIVESDHIEQVFVSYATISEAGNTNNSYDKFYAEEEAFFSKAKPEFSLLMQKRNQAIFDCKFVEELRGLLGGEFLKNTAVFPVTGIMLLRREPRGPQDPETPPDRTNNTRLRSPVYTHTPRPAPRL